MTELRLRAAHHVATVPGSADDLRTPATASAAAHLVRTWFELLDRHAVELAGAA